MGYSLRFSYFFTVFVLVSISLEKSLTGLFDILIVIIFVHGSIDKYYLSCLLLKIYCRLSKKGESM